MTADRRALGSAAACAVAFVLLAVLVGGLNTVTKSVLDPPTDVLGGALLGTATALALVPVLPQPPTSGR